MNPTSHLIKFYKHYFNEDKVKRNFLKNSYIRLLLPPKSINNNLLTYTFEGEWSLEAELQTFTETENKLEVLI